MHVCKSGSNRLQGIRVLCHVKVRDNSVQTSRVCSMQTDKCRVFTGFDSKGQLKVRAPILFVSLPFSSCIPSPMTKSHTPHCKRRKTYPIILRTTHRQVLPVLQSDKTSVAT
jgi:hypothetical protein